MYLAVQREKKNHSSWHKLFTAANQISCCQDYFGKSQINNEAACHFQVYILIIKWALLQNLHNSDAEYPQPFSSLRCITVTLTTSRKYKDK